MIKVTSRFVFIVLVSLGATLMVVGPGGCGSSSNGGGGGSTGAGGTGASADSCQRACDKARALHCPNDTETQPCATGCQFQAAFPICRTELDALSACSANATFTCDDKGKATAQGCSSEGLAYFTCFLGGFDAGFGGD